MTNITDRAQLVAQYFVWKNQVEPKTTGLDKLKLQKLLYYAQAWNLVFNGKTLFSNNIEAWVHGPAIADIYQTYKNFDFVHPSVRLSNDDFKSFSVEERKILDDIWDVYGKYDGSYLESLTHSELPWQEARSGMSSVEPSQNIISTQRMKEYYGEKFERSKKVS